VLLIRRRLAHAKLKSSSGATGSPGVKFFGWFLEATETARYFGMTIAN
jgi:hypothetical protein